VRVKHREREKESEAAPSKHLKRKKIDEERC
jgi:hypothetical protein